jgi:phytoene dehydrogenase-like protein
MRALVVGSGHNGLAAAAYLARGGVQTRVLERRDILGGACVTEELWPGYQVSRAAYVAGLLRPGLIRELELHRHGLRLLRRDPSSYTPLPDAPGLLMGSSLADTQAQIRRFSPRDAERYPAYEALLDGLARTFEPLLDGPPPDPGGLRLRDVPELLALARRLLRLRRDLARGLSLLLGPARTTLESWFESEILRGTLATDALIGAWAGPSTPGTGYVLFHHVMGETNGQRGVWAYVQGGMGQLSEALARAAREVGVEIRTDARVEQLAVQDGRVRGVVLAGGEFVEADLVLSGADPRHTFLELTPPDALPAEFRDEVRHLDFRSPVVKLNLALERLPQFRHGSGQVPGPEHRGTIHVGALDLDALERSYEAARAGRLPERPMVELTLPSALDPSLAPEGRHVASLFVQHVPYAPSEGSWDELRDVLADRVTALVDEVAPGFSQSVLHREVLAPPDLERIFGLAGGNIFHGAMTPDRLLFMRPLPGWSRYRTPIQGLYLCGAGAHPGGGVMGACGRNAAREALTSLRGRVRA